MNKNKFLDKLNAKNITKTFGIILFVLVFVFTFLFTATDPVLSEHKITILIVFGCVALFLIICWLALFLIVRHYKKSQDTNKQKIDKALDKLKKDAIEEREKIEDESKF